MIIKIGRKVIQILLFLSAGFPAQSESQTLTTGISSCEPNPYRLDNTYTKNPYDDIAYYKCYSIDDKYRTSETEVQSRKTCEYTKVVYYDPWMRSWTNTEISKACKARDYELNQKKDAIIPEGWHPPLRTR